MWKKKLIVWEKIWNSNFKEDMQEEMIGKKGTKYYFFTKTEKLKIKHMTR